MEKIYLLFGTFIASWGMTIKAQAICPICTMAVVAGMGLSRWLGIDDTIAGLWIGALAVSLIAWTISWLDRKNIRFYGRKITVAAAYYLLILAPLYFYHIIGHPLNTLWGMDKLLFGIIVGSVVFLLGALWYYQLKEQNHGHAYFPFQKVVMPVAPLIILSIIFYFLTK
jgi:hypothetical protein